MAKRGGRSKAKKDTVEDLKDTLYSRGHAPEIHPEVRTPLSEEVARPAHTWSDGVTPPAKIREEEFITHGTIIGGAAVAPEEDEVPAVHESASASTTSEKTVPMLEHAPPLLFTQMNAKKKRRLSLPAKFFLGSMSFFVLACAGAAYFFFAGSNTISPANIDLAIEVPSVVDGGKPTTLQIVVSNRNTSALQLVDLILDYPDGTRDPTDQTQALSHERQSIGTIASGQQLLRTSSAVFFGAEGVPETVNATLEYTLPGSNAIFQKQANVTFTVGSSPVSLSVTAPTEAVAGQPFEIDITAQSNSTNPITDVVVQGQYPFGFTPTSATPPGAVGTTLWRLGTLTPGASQIIKLIGTIDGQDGDQRIFRFLTGSDTNQTDTQIAVPFLTVPTTLTVQKPFISGQLTLNGQSGKNVSIAAGTQVSGTITWQNNLPDSIANAELVLTLTGPMLDPTSVNAATGFYQSNNSTITWSKDQEPSLALIPPGGSGSLPFSFSVKNVTADGTLYTNPTVDLNLAVSGVRQGQDNVPESVASATTLEATVSSSATLTAQALHFSGPFSDGGPMPPTVGAATTYTVLWTVSNSSNTVGNAVVSATLPPYVTFVAAQDPSVVTYDTPSRTVTWSLGDVKAGVGYTLPSRSEAFQVSLLPSSSQLGSSPALTSAAQLSGQDRFAQVPVTSTAQVPTTQLLNDSGYQLNMGQVVGQ